MDDIRISYSTPFDNPLIPHFPVEMRDTEILTVMQIPVRMRRIDVISFVLPFGEVIHDYLKQPQAPHA